MRTIVTVVAGLAWLALLLVWWAFWSEDYTVAQKFAVTVMSLIVMGTLAGAIWIPFSRRSGEDADQWEQPGFTSRILVTVLLFGGLALLVVYLLFFPWKDFNWCQSLVVIIVIFIAFVAIMAPLWMSQGRTRVHMGVEIDDIAEEVSEEIEDAIEDAFERSRKDDDDDDDDD